MSKIVKEFLDKSANYEVIERIENLQQENKILKENAENNDKVVDKVNWENQLLKKENEQLKDNWNKLKEYINRYIKYDKYGRKISKCLNAIVIMNKINKLEQRGDSNE